MADHDGQTAIIKLNSGRILFTQLFCANTAVSMPLNTASEVRSLTAKTNSLLTDHDFGRSVYDAINGAAGESESVVCGCTVHCSTENTFIA